MSSVSVWFGDGSNSLFESFDIRLSWLNRLPAFLRSRHSFNLRICSDSAWECWCESSDLGEECLRLDTGYGSSEYD